MKISKNLKHIFIVASITFFMILAVMRLFGPTFSTPITQFFVYRENVPFLNWLYKYDFEPSPEIVLVTIDDTTLNTFQQYGDLKNLTIPKSAYQSVINNIYRGGAKGIAVDIVFQNADPDEAIFASFLKNQKTTVLAVTNQENQECFDEVATAENPIASRWKTCNGIPRSVYQNSPWGHIHVQSDMSGTGVNQEHDYAGRISLKYQMSGFLTGELDIKNGEFDFLPLALYKQVNPGKFTRYDNSDFAFQPYFGKPFDITHSEASYARYNFAKVYYGTGLQGGFSDVDLKANFGGKYVFIGESGTFIHDSMVSPVTGTKMDGVEGHAHFLNGILKDRYLWSLDNTMSFYIGILMYLTIMMSGIYMMSRMVWGLGFLTCILLLTIFVSRYVYVKNGIVVDIGPVLLAGGIFSFPVTYIYRFFIVDREKRLLTSAFAHYVDPEVVHEISERAEDISLGGESRELSVLFSDIAGFTTISERLKPTDLFYLMSSYLSRMTDILTREGGTLDKYIGDAVMGFFGAPLTQYDHAIRACETALEMRDALPAFNAELESRGIEPIDFRVGIASGDVLVGNIGSHDRFNYTVLGDTVNLASRLEATSKEYGTHIIVSEGTYLLARDHYSFRKLDLITVKGKNEPVGIYELIAKKSDNTINKALYERYEKALDLYMQADYLGAGKFWETQIDIDPPSRAMAHRCLDILKGDITIVDGVYHMTKK